MVKLYTSLSITSKVIDLMGNLVLLTPIKASSAWKCRNSLKELSSVKNQSLDFSQMIILKVI